MLIGHLDRLDYFYGMRKLIFLLALFFMTGCNDGEVFVTEFDFDDAGIQLCDNSPDDDELYVFYKINTETNETLLLTFESSTDIFGEVGEIDDIDLERDNNVFEYRRFNGVVDEDYFCSSVPPATPTAVEVITADSGFIRITQLLVTDEDNDGIPATAEGAVVLIDGNIDDSESIDSDMDGIPDYQDQDDDNDNVPTANEGVVITDGAISNNSRDTNMDGKYDYLDCDDDGDGVNTRQEDRDRDLDPSDDRANPGALAYYLLPSETVAADPAITTFRINRFDRTIEIQIVLTDLVFSNGDAAFIEEEFFFGTFSDRTVSVQSTPTTVVCQ